MKSKQLWRRIELARIKARALYVRQRMIWGADYRRSKREDKDEQERARLRGDVFWMLSGRRALMDMYLMPRDHSGSLSKYEQLCASTEPDQWIELDHEEWNEIESWRKAPFAAHPSNAEAYPELV